MGFNNFRRALSLRVLLLAGSLALLIYLLQSTDLHATAALAGAAAVYQLVSLISLVEATNRVTDRFLSSVAAADYSESFTTGLSGRTFDELNDRLRELMARFRDINLEKEATHRYLKMIVRHAGVGLIAFDDGGRVELANDTARQLLGVTPCTSRRCDRPTRNWQSCSPSCNQGAGSWSGSSVTMSSCNSRCRHRSYGCGRGGSPW